MAGDNFQTSKEVCDDIAFFGGDPKQMEQQETDFFIHPDNWLAFVAFNAAQTQWVLDNKGRKFALNYQNAEIAWQKLNMNVEGDDFRKVQHLERCVRESV